MCGIGGFVDFGRPGASWAPELARLAARLRHRGPDGDGAALLSHAALASTRLALLDPARGSQPWRSADGRFTLVYNGEIWSHLELRARLPAREWRSGCDTETLLAAWEAWGEACLPRLGGMFAFFLWDEELQEGFAARDLLGIKPFVFARRGESFAFASEAKALLPFLPERPRLRPEAILEYLAAPIFSGVATPIFCGLEYLPPGHLLRIGRNGARLRRWGRFDLRQAREEDPALAGELAARLARAADLAARADAAVGIFLSGGLDSTGLAALARRAGHTLPAFTVRFAGQAEFDYSGSRIVGSDDSPFAVLAARELELPHHFVEVDRGDLAADLRRLAEINDALPAWEQELALLHLSRRAAGRCKAVLLGDAADETHWGYHFLLDDEAIATPAAILRRFADAPLRRELLEDPVAHFDRACRELAAREGHDFADPEQRRNATAALIVARWLPRLLHNSDLHTMAWGLEGRVPFGDPELLELAARVSPRLGLQGGREKALLRRALEGMVPAEVAARRKSALPKDQATAEIYRREAAAQIAAWPELYAAYLELPAVERLLEPGRDLGENERALLFRLICLGHFARHHGVAPP